MPLTSELEIGAFFREDRGGCRAIRGHGRAKSTSGKSSAGGAAHRRTGETQYQEVVGLPGKGSLDLRLSAPALVSASLHRHIPVAYAPLNTANEKRAPSDIVKFGSIKVK